MKKLIAIAALALAMPTVAAAQDAARGQGRQQMLSTIEYLVKLGGEFNATPEQLTKLEALAATFAKETSKHREEMQKVREEMQAGGDRSALMQKMRPIREEMQRKDDAAIEEALKVLNAEQQEYVKKLVEARREQRANRPGRPATGVIKP